MIEVDITSGGKTYTGSRDPKKTELHVMITSSAIEPQGELSLENITSGGIRDIVVLTKEEFLALEEPREYSLYLIKR